MFLASTPAISSDDALNLLVGGNGLTNFDFPGDPFLASANTGLSSLLSIRFKFINPLEGEIFRNGLLANAFSGDTVVDAW